MTPLCLSSSAADMIERKKKMWHYLQSVCHGRIHLFLYLDVVVVAAVNNGQNTHGPLSSFPLSVSASLTRFLYLIPCADDDDSGISFSLCLPPHSDKCTHQLGPRGQAL